MRVHTGCDLVHIPTFQAKVVASNGQLLERVFHTHELIAKPSDESRAGMYAMKEAALKAFSLTPGSWHAIEITYTEAGAPQLSVAEHDCSHTSVSVSHHSEYAMAFVVHLAV
jgi:phosphopantetheine--protein transferase-like protein